MLLHGLLRVIEALIVPAAGVTAAVRVVTPEADISNTVIFSQSQQSYEIVTFFSESQKSYEIVSFFSESQTSYAIVAFSIVVVTVICSEVLTRITIDIVNVMTPKISCYHLRLPIIFFYHNAYTTTSAFTITNINSVVVDRYPGLNKRIPTQPYTSTKLDGPTRCE